MISTTCAENGVVNLFFGEFDFKQAGLWRIGLIRQTAGLLKKLSGRIHRVMLKYLVLISGHVHGLDLVCHCCHSAVVLSVDFLSLLLLSRTL